MSSNISENTTVIYGPIDVAYFIELEIAANLWKTVAPILIIGGLAGNALSVAVLVRKKMWKMACSHFLVILAFTDSFVLILGPTMEWAQVCFGLQVRELSDHACKVYKWLTYAVPNFAVWIIVAVTVERYITVCFPLRAQTICSRKKGYVFMALIFVFHCILNGHFLFGMKRSCVSIATEYQRFLDNEWLWLDLMAFSGFPFFVIVFSNISILVTVSMSKEEKLSTSITGDQAKKRAAQNKQMTAMLLILNTVVLVTTAPVILNNLLLGYKWVPNETAHDKAVLELCRTAVWLLMYVSNSSNFLLYCLSAPRFRAEVLALLRLSSVHKE